jgi:hypothetical protein
MREIEGPLQEFVPEWIGPEIVDIMTKAAKLFDDLGGYPLPQATQT